MSKGDIKLAFIDPRYLQQNQVLSLESVRSTRYYLDHRLLSPRRKVTCLNNIEPIY